MKRRTTQVRILPEDKSLLDNYCKTLGLSRPTFLNKVLRSNELKLNERVLNEYKKKEEELKKKQEELRRGFKII